MIQIVQAYPKPDGSGTSYRYTAPPILLHSLSQVFKQSNAIVDAIVAAGGTRENLFYTVAHHAGAATSKYPTRTKPTFEFQTMLPFDIDWIDGGRWGEYAAIVAKALQAPLEALTCVSTGNGLHCIIGLKNPIRHQSYFDDEKPGYKEICRQIESEIRKAGLPTGPDFKVDTVVFEAARILRLPGSLNIKGGHEPKECRLLQGPSDATLDIDLFKLSGLKDRVEQNVSPQEIKRQYPKPDFAEMVRECRFIQWASQNPKEVHEPQAFDLFSLLVPCGDALTESGQTPRQLAEAVFVGATASASLKQSDFDEKWQQAQEYGGRKCSTIDQHWDRCKECPHLGKIQTPLALKSKEHIGSASNGYWVRGANGQPMYPAYEDLVKVLQQGQPIIATPDERLLGYANSIYTEVSDLQIKHWIETTVVPSEPLRESHRSEFLRKVKAQGFLYPDRHKEVFETNTRSKLNCLNGVINILTGELSEHSPEAGFLYQLPYAIDLAAEGPAFFLDWLEQITESRVELIEAILDMMAYLLWPSYDDHVFAYFIGEGANGKSTLIELIQALVGKDAFSAVGLQHLCTNRFAPAQLEGKLVNLSSESSGGGAELTSENLNILKTLSSGEAMMIERKGREGYSFSNQAKLIFSANKAPHFRETGHALERRMLVIPFDHTIQKPDSRVGARLKEEIPRIVPYLIRRIRQNVKQHGRFQVSRGGVSAVQAREKMLTEYNTVCAWARDALDIGAELGEGAYIESQSAFGHYQDWCARNGFKNTQNRVAFGRSMCNYVMTYATGKETQFRWVDKKSIRVYPFMKFKETSLAQTN